MKILSKLVAVCSVISLTACGGQPLSPQEMNFLQAQAEQQTLKIDCPSGCSISYKDPRDKVVIPQRTNGWDAAIAATGSLERMTAGAIPVLGMGYLGKEAIKALKGSGATTITNTSVANTSSIGDYSGDSSGRVGDYSGGQSGNGGILGDYAGQQSGNSGSLHSDIPGRVNSPNEGRFSSPDDYSNNSRITN